MKNSTRQLKKARAIKKIVLMALCCALVVIVWTTTSLSAQEWHIVQWVADGDTIFLKDGRHIRFIGINAPEVAHDNLPAEPFGYTAKKRLSELVEKRKVRLEWDEIRTDRYGRKLAYVFDQDNRLLNQVMLAEGLAHVLFHQGNQRYFDRLLHSQQRAMAEKKGFWRTFRFNSNYSHFWGNKRSLRFHTPDCEEGKKIGRRNRIKIGDPWSSFQQGYAPAKGCLKGIGAFIK